MAKIKIKTARTSPRIKSSRKKRVLVWADSGMATTGFGTVSKNILKALHNTGRFEIEHFAINHNGTFSTKEFPYQFLSTRLDHKDPIHGRQLFLNLVRDNDYDIVFVINDAAVTHEPAKLLQKVFDVRSAAGRKIPSVIYYYPVDCTLPKSVSGMVEHADRVVAYTHFAREETKRTGLDCTDIVYHGTDIHSFYPLPSDQRRTLRKQIFGIDDDTFLWINVNRNTPRKDVAKTILAFSEFKKQVPNSKLYLHMSPIDSVGSLAINLQYAIDHLGISNKDIAFPVNFNSGQGYPVEVLNQLYNCGDAFISTALGEGWGLTTTEAMSCGIPVLLPDNSTTPEILGEEERGYIYPCKEMVFLEISGYRKMGRTEDIVKKMIELHTDVQLERIQPGSTKLSKRTKEARKFVEEYSWENINKHWIKIFDETDSYYQKQSTEPESL